MGSSRGVKREEEFAHERQDIKENKRYNFSHARCEILQKSSELGEKDKAATTTTGRTAKDKKRTLHDMPHPLDRFQIIPCS